MATASTAAPRPAGQRPALGVLPADWLDSRHVGDRMLVVSTELVIPLDELQLSFSGSSGPGGQHVNRNATRVSVRFDVRRSPSLTDDQRQLLLERLAHRLDHDGVLQIHAQDTRSQRRNRDTALERLAALLAQALKQRPTRRRTRPTSASVEARLHAKRRRADQKESRRPPNWSEGGP